MKNNRGYFITVEGIEGAGKSNAIEFLTKLLKTLNIDLVVTREPGGTPIAEAMRKLLLDHHQEQLASTAELLLIFASRAQHLQTVIKPALARGQWVLCDRFTDASYAYQGGGRGVSQEHIANLEQLVQEGLSPDLVLLLDVPVEVGLARIYEQRHTKDRIEKETVDFFARVREAYLTRAYANPKRYKIIDANYPLSTVQDTLGSIVTEFIDGI